jgi:hypothetical protein
MAVAATSLAALLARTTTRPPEGTPLREPPIPMTGHPQRSGEVATGMQKGRPQLHDHVQKSE